MLTLIETKAHLRVDGTDEDALIEALMSAATAASADYLNMPLDQLTSTVPSPIKAATLLMIAGLFEQREDQSERPLHHNTTYERLLNPYRAMAL